MKSETQKKPAAVPAKDDWFLAGLSILILLLIITMACFARRKISELNRIKATHQ
jgi:hypothetical protein